MSGLYVTRDESLAENARLQAELALVQAENGRLREQVATYLRRSFPVRTVATR